MSVEEGFDCVAFAHYGANGDVSGVTSWLERFALSDVFHDLSKFLHVYHYSSNLSPDFTTGSLVQSLSRSDSVSLSGANFCNFRSAADSVAGVIDFLNVARPTVFIPQCVPEFFYAATWAAQSGLPWVFTFHSDDPLYWSLAELCGPEVGEGVWVAVSNHIASEIKRRIGDVNVKVIPCGVRLPPFIASNPGPRFKIAYCGRLVETQKRVSLVLETIVAACRMSDSIDAVIIGDGEARCELESLVREQGFGSRIHFTGRLNSEEVFGEFKTCQSCLLMSDFEGMPVALMEAMASGVVPVAREIKSGVPDLVINGETGILVNDDPIDAARHIVSLASDRARWEHLSVAARKHIDESFSEDSCFRKWREVISEVSQMRSASFPIPPVSIASLARHNKDLANLLRRPNLIKQYLLRLKNFASSRLMKVYHRALGG